METEIFNTAFPVKESTSETSELWEEMVKYTNQEKKETILQVVTVKTVKDNSTIQ